MNNLNNILSQVSNGYPVVVQLPNGLYSFISAYGGIVPTNELGTNLTGVIYNRDTGFSYITINGEWDTESFSFDEQKMIWSCSIK